MTNNYLKVRKGPDGNVVVINIPGFQFEILQKKDKTLQGAFFEGQHVEGFITGVRATVHTMMLRPGQHEDYRERIRKCCEIIRIIDELVEEHNSNSKTKLEIYKTF